MNTAIIGQLLSAIDVLVPLVPGGAAVAPILDTLIKVVPVAIQEAEDLAPIVKNIITALKNDPATNAAQLTTLATLDAQVDAAFDAAAAAAEAEDA